MDFHLWLTFFASCWVIAISPGSGAVLSISHGMNYGVRQTSATILGLQLGLTITGLIAGVGVGALLLASATAFTVVKVMGAFYLFYLGVQQWRAPIDETISNPAQPSVDSELGLSFQTRFLTGLFTNVTNPKGIVFMVAVLPQFIDPQQSLSLQLLILLGTMVSVDLVVMHGYALMGARTQSWLSNARAKRFQNRLFGGVLMFMGSSLLLVRRGN